MLLALAMTSTVLLSAALVPPALAADPAGYAQRAELDLPPEGAALIDLDDAQLWRGRDDLLLLNADGQEVPYVMLGSWQEQQGGCQAVPWDPVGPPPRYDTIRVDTRELGRVIDRLRVDPGPVGGGLFSGGSALISFGDGAWAMPMEVYADGERVAEGLLWRANIAHADRENMELEVPLLPPGVYDIKAPTALRWRGVSACWTASTDIQPLTFDVDVSGPVTDGASRSLYSITLPAAGLELTDLSLAVSDARYRRDIAVSGAGYPGSSGGQDAGVIERLTMGGASIEHTELALRPVMGDQLLLQVDDGRDAPLTITGATVTLRNRQLLVVDAGPGPHALYAAPSTPRGDTYDLDHAVVELLRGGPPRVRPARWSDNPAYNPAQALPAALLRGAIADLTGYRIKREMQAPRAGVPTRWELPDEVLVSASPGLAELRLVDVDGNQVPYVLEQVGVKTLAATLTTEVEAGQTRLRVKLPAAARVEHLVLRSSSEVFSRRVRAEGGGSSQWTRGPDAAQRALVISLGGAVTDSVVILIDDGDDQALEGLTVEVVGRTSALVAAAPEGGATLWYGVEGASRPDYDLHMLTGRLLSGVVAHGSVGPAVITAKTSEQDRTLGLLAVGVLAIALVLLAASLLRDPAKPEGDAAKPEGDASA